jgi:hypothetical protein
LNAEWKIGWGNHALGKSLAFVSVLARSTKVAIALETGGKSKENQGAFGKYFAEVFYEELLSLLSYFVDLP